MNQALVLNAVAKEREAEIQYSAVYDKVMVFGGLTYPLMAEYKKAADAWLDACAEERRVVVDAWLAAERAEREMMEFWRDDAVEAEALRRTIAGTLFGSDDRAIRAWTAERAEKKREAGQ